MAIIRVHTVKTAEIEKDTQIIQAEQSKQTAILIAEGVLETKKREAEATLVEGAARAASEKLMQLAPVEAQIVLAKEIGGNEGYQKYLVSIRQLEATEHIGMEQAKALEQADVKIISNSGSPGAGLNNVMDLFSSNGGTKVGAMLEALAQTETGSDLLSKLTNKAVLPTVKGKVS